MGLSRQYPNGNETEFKDCLKEVSTVYDDIWLNESPPVNPIQELWQRVDTLSSCELIILGESLRKIKTISSEWLTKTVRNSKSESLANARGAAFEIITSALWHNPPYHEVTFPPINEPGYDIKVIFPNNLKFVISIKNFGESTKSKATTFKSRELENIVASNLSIPTDVIITNSRFPTSTAWKKLIRKIPKVLMNNQRVKRNIEHGWTILKIPNLQNLVPFAGKQSYSLTSVIPYHKNEILNAMSNIESAIQNLENHANQESDILCNIVFLHTSPNIDIELCEKWGREYFSQYETNVSTLIFFQSHRVTKGDNSVVQHTFKVVSKNNAIHRIIKRNSMILKPIIPLGVISDSSPRKTLSFNGTLVSLSEQYVYRSGKYFQWAENENGKQSGTVQYINGIKVNKIFKINEKQFLISGRFPPDEKLRLI
jgi:hypothetical protein